jgi:hypothetical protein
MRGIRVPTFNIENYSQASFEDNTFETGQPKLKCQFMVPPLKCDYFVGESHMVSWFKANKFHEGKPTEHGPIKVTLVGPGGVGYASATLFLAPQKI